jgi:RNA polymerase sigma-70 factor (ECF subfamily)
MPLRPVFVSRRAARRVRTSRTPPLDDRALVTRVLAGEHEAFRELLERHTPALLATLRSAVGRDDAREVLQETWLRAWSGLGDLRDPERLRSWLLSVALNLARSRSRRPETAPLDAERLVDERNDGAVRPERVEELARLRLALAGLPARQREVVDLRVNHELSHAEIAGLLGIREEASRASYSHGLRRLRQVLGASRP